MRFFTLQIFLFFCSHAFCLVVGPAKIQAQLDQAILVAEIKVEHLEITPDPAMHALSTATASILKITQIKDDGGWFPVEGDSIQIEGIGGEWNGTGVFISGYPRPHVGRSYLAYLQRHGSHAFEVTGFEKGFSPLGGPTRDFSRNRSDGSNGEGNGPFLYWDKSYFPIPYFISQPSFQSLPEAPAAIDASFKAWRDPPDVRTEFLAMGCSIETRAQNDGINNIILVTRNWPFDPSAIAITRNFYIAGNSPRAGMILDSDILLNGVDYAFTVSDEPGKYDVQDIVTHEAGHFIGMGHQVIPVDGEATMYAMADPNEYNKRTLHAEDLLGLRAAYGGVGAKVASWPRSPSCDIPTGTTSCIAVHGREPEPWLPLAGILYILVNWALGKWVIVRRR